MYDEVYGYTKIKSKHNITTKIELSPRSSNHLLSDYSISLTIINRYNDFAMLLNFPIPNTLSEYILPNDLILKLNGEYYLDIIYKHDETSVVYLDRSELSVDAYTTAVSSDIEISDDIVLDGGESQSEYTCENSTELFIIDGGEA